MNWLTDKELKNLGFKEIGKNVLIDDSCLLLKPNVIQIGNNVRIDAFCVLSPGEGKINISDNVHIGHGTRLYGSGNIDIGTGSTISSGCGIFSASDDFSGGSLVNPMVPNIFRNVNKERISIGDHSVIGSNSVLLPGAKLGRDAAVGALSLVKSNVADYTLVAGSPAREILTRDASAIEQKISDFERLNFDK